MTKDPDELPLNPYASPAATSSYELEPSESGELTPELLERKHLRIFVGPRASYYLSKWMPALHRGGRADGFHWAAFWFSGFWLPYRKMYRYVSIFFALVFVEATLEDIIFVRLLGQEIPTIVELGSNIAIGVLCALFANHLYLRHARRVIQQVRALNLDEEATCELLRKRGGTSVVAGIGILLAYLALMMGAMLVVDILIFGDEL